MPASPVAPATIAQALAGENPPLGHRLTQAELGERLAAHRQGRYPGQPFTKQAISLYTRDPGQQSPDFMQAFRSWTLAETQRQAELRLLADDMTVDELLQESSGRVVQVGASPAVAVVVIGQLPPGALIAADGGVPHLVLNRSEVRRCACGQWFVARSWNQRRCQPGCKDNDPHR